MSKSNQVRGEFFVIGTCILEGLFPIIAYSASREFPIFFFTGASVALAMIILGVLLIITKGYKNKVPLWSLGACAMVSLLVVIIPLNLIMAGAKHTSGINTALILQVEILSTFIIYKFLFKEHHELYQYIGALLVFSGTALVLFNGTMTLNKGDLLILLAVWIFPFGNYFAKKALTVLKPMQVIFFRYLFALPVLILISIIFEDLSGVLDSITRSGWIIVAYVVLILISSKMFWYYGLRKLPVSKSIYILSAIPAFSLIFAFALLDEIPTVYQWAGFIVAIVGVYTLIAKRQISTAGTDLV